MERLMCSGLNKYWSASSHENNWAVVENFGNTAFTSNANVLYEAPFYTIANKEAGLSHLFYVKLREIKDTVYLKELALKNNIEILGSNRFMPLWYTLACTKDTKGNALEMANNFYESDSFSFAEPDLMVSNGASCVNDKYFNNQWGLKNTGQFGGTVTPDINICDAWQITKGSKDVIIAIIDDGVELDHPDLTNIFPLSFDTEKGTTPSIVRGKHGTACSGIISANADNDSGIAGIAPDCPLMSISYESLSPNINQKIADGFNFAWKNGASVISNSYWKTSSSYIDDAIASALSSGRNGLGCVVVFAAGNDNYNIVDYPARSNTEIIVVGALSPCGERKNYSSCDGEFWPGLGSNYGIALDIMAPGVFVPTTDRVGNKGYVGHSDYDTAFSGTSAACPHVAAVAGLILSVNPGLTQIEVADIIEQTAQKINPTVYTYQTTAGRPNRTWNSEMGYGVLDANAAVAVAKNMCSSSTADLYMKDKYNDFGTEPNPDADEVYWDSKDIWVRRQNDGFTNQVHQNPEYRPAFYGVPNYIYVKVRNRGCAASLGANNKLKLYWAKAATALDWPAPWDGSKNTPSIEWGNLIAIKTISSIAAGNYTIFEYEWYPPDTATYTGINTEPWHFCLLARIETSNTSPYGMTYPETACLWCNVKDNNNIVWRNITVIDSVAGAGAPPPPGGNGGKGCVMIKNTSTTSYKTTKLKLSIPDEELNNSVLDHCTIKINLGDSLTQEWISGGMQGGGIAFSNDSLISLLNEGAWVGNIIMRPQEERIITVYIASTQLPLLEEQRYTYLFDIIQSDNDTIRGGERFEVNLDFEPAPSETAICTSIKNKLFLPHFNDVSVYPNPANEKFFISTKTDVVYKVVIIDILGKTIYENEFQKNLSIDVSAIPKGIYFVRSLNTDNNSQSISKVVIQ